MDRSVKHAVIIGAVLAGLGVIYYLVIYLPGVERRKAADAARREAQRQRSYDSCLAEAQTSYEAYWAAACEGVARSRAAELTNCLSDRNKVALVGREYCERTYGNADPSPACTLPEVRSDPINAIHKEANALCVKKASLGL